MRRCIWCGWLGGDQGNSAARPQEEGYWKGDGVSGAPSIVIDLASQKAFL
jgi:hypothetical protein